MGDKAWRLIRKAVLGRERCHHFDFNGVLADDETPHVLCFQRALREAGMALSAEEYYGTTWAWTNGPARR